MSFSGPAAILVALVAALHLGFLVLEMFLWGKPFGLLVFGHSLEVFFLVCVVVAGVCAAATASHLILPAQALPAAIALAAMLLSD